VFSTALSADGRFAISGSGDKTIRLWEIATGQCVGVYGGHTQSVFSVALSLDGRWLLSAGEDKVLRVQELDWELTARDPADWDEGALPLLKTFLSSHIPYRGVLRPDRDLSEERILQALTRRGDPVWSEQDFQLLIDHLQYAGYGWLHPAGVRAKLEELVRSMP
jgi:WD40 repeat protein